MGGQPGRAAAQESEGGERTAGRGLPRGEKPDPFGQRVNPALPGWEDDLHRCAEKHAMRGIRLHPNYHGYKLDDPRFAQLLALADKRRLIVQIALSMEDERTQHPLMRVAQVDPEPLADIIGRFPRLRLVLLNRHWAEDWPLVRKLSQAGQAYFDFAMLEAGRRRYVDAGSVAGTGIVRLPLAAVLFRVRVTEGTRGRVERRRAGLRHGRERPPSSILKIT